jgi:hypothetical protein
MQGNDGKFKPEHVANGLNPSLRANGSRECAPDDRLREAIHGYEESLDCFVASLLAMTEKNIYRLVSRQPAASASSTEQNQRVPLEMCIWIFAYQRLVGL